MSFRSGVIAFAEDDSPSEEQQHEVIRQFERLAFAGLEGNQFDILWLRHEHEGNIKLHFVTPRVELITGKSLNIAPPNFFSAFDALGDVLNKKYDWKDPRDPLNARETIQPRETTERAESREALNEWVSAQIAEGRITDRASMIEALESIGFTINHQVSDYLSVKDPETDQKFHLKGEIYYEKWTTEQFTHSASTKGYGGSSETKRRLDQFGIRELRENLEEHIAKRASYNQQRYRRVDEAISVSALEIAERSETTERTDQYGNQRDGEGANAMAEENSRDHSHVLDQRDHNDDHSRDAVDDSSTS